MVITFSYFSEAIMVRCEAQCLARKRMQFQTIFFFLLRSTICSAWQNSKTQTLGRAVDNMLTPEYKATNFIFSNIYINIEQLMQEKKIMKKLHHQGGNQPQTVPDWHKFHWKVSSSQYQNPLDTL